MQSAPIIRATIQSDPSIPSEQRERLLAALEPSKPATEKMITRLDVAGMLNCHPETVKRYGKKGLLHPVRFSARAVRYPESEVLSLMRNGAGGSI